MDLRILLALLVCIFAVSSHRQYGGGYGSRRHGHVSRRRVGYGSHHRYGTARTSRRRSRQSRRRYRVRIHRRPTTVVIPTTAATTKRSTTTAATTASTPTSTASTAASTSRSTTTTERTPPITSNSDNARIAAFLNGQEEASDYDDVDKDLVRRIMDLIRKKSGADQFADLVDDYDEVPVEDGEPSVDTASDVKEVKDEDFANELEEMLEK